MEIHMIQHGLWDTHSHLYNDTVLWRDLFQKLGIPCNIYANVRFSQYDGDRLNASPTFNSSPEAIIEPDRSLRDLADFIDVSEMFAYDCVSTFGDRLGPDDLVLVPYATEREVFGAALWLQTRPASAHPRLAFIVHRPDYNWAISTDRETVKGNFSFWSYAGRRLSRTNGTAAPFIGTPDRHLARLLGNILGSAVRHIPMMHFVAPTHGDATGRDIDIGLLGEFRPERGSTRIPEILAEAARAAPARRFLVQVRKPGQADAIRAAFADAGAASSVEVLTGDLQQPDFHRAMSRCRLLILPYVPSRYRMRSSGMLSDAVSLGLPVMVPSGTWLSDRVEEGSAAGIVYPELTAQAVQTALDAPDTEKAALLDQAAKLAPAWRENNSHGRVFEQIQQHFVGTPPPT